MRGLSGSSQQMSVSLTGFLPHTCTLTYNFAPYSVMPAAKPTVEYTGLASQKPQGQGKADLVSTQGTATETPLQMLWPQRRLCCQLSLALAYAVIWQLGLVEICPQLHPFWLSALSSHRLNSHIVREFYPIAGPRELYCKHGNHLQCGPFDYPYWASFPPRGDRVRLCCHG